MHRPALGAQAPGFECGEGRKPRKGDIECAKPGGALLWGTAAGAARPAGHAPPRAIVTETRMEKCFAPFPVLGLSPAGGSPRVDALTSCGNGVTYMQIYVFYGIIASAELPDISRAVSPLFPRKFPHGILCATARTRAECGELSSPQICRWGHVILAPAAASGRCSVDDGMINHKVHLTGKDAAMIADACIQSTAYRCCARALGRDSIMCLTDQLRQCLQ